MSAKESLYLDQGVLANLYATGQVRSLLQLLPYQFFVMDDIEQKPLLLWPESLEEGQEQQPREPVPVSALIEHNLILAASFDVFANCDIFVEFAGIFPDSQAKLLALAYTSSATIATDDKLIQRTLQEKAPEVCIYTTLNLLHQWELQCQKSNEEMSSIVKRITKKASFEPEQDDPLFGWWNQFHKVS